MTTESTQAAIEFEAYPMRIDVESVRDVATQDLTRNCVLAGRFERSEAVCAQVVCKPRHLG